MIDILDNVEQSFQLKIELAILVDFADPIVKGCYFLKGDGPLVLHTYNCVKAIEAHICAPSYPNIEALVRSKFPQKEVQRVHYDLGAPACSMSGQQQTTSLHFLTET